MKKRLLPAFLALALCLGLAVPASAVDVEDATQEDIKSTFTILRNGTIDETKGIYTSGKKALLDLYLEGDVKTAYEVYDENDSWTITNTGSKALSSNGSTDYSISFGYAIYGNDPWDGRDSLVEIGGSGSLGFNGDGGLSFVYGDAPDEPVILEAGESITIPASLLGSGSPENTISELYINIYYYGGETGDSCHYTFYFGYDPAEKAAIEKNLAGNEPAPGFTDVPGWCAPAVSWAVAQEITNGTGENKFSPDDKCKHAEILTFLWRAAGKPESDAALPVDIAGKNVDWAAAALRWAAEKGMVDGALDPAARCTRADAVAYIWKALGKSDAFSPDYAPFTLSGNDTYGKNPSGGRFTLQFDAAVTVKTKVTLHHDDDLITEIIRDYEDPSTYDVTLIAVRPGSRYTIDGGFYGFSYFADTEDGSIWIDGVPGMPYFRAKDGTFRRARLQMGHDDTEFALYEDSLSEIRLHGGESGSWGNEYSTDCGVLIQLDGAYYFVTYADSATAAGLLGTSFSDVPAGADYAQAVAWAVANGVTNGYGDGAFGPDKVCSRGEIVTFLHRAYVEEARLK